MFVSLGIEKPIWSMAEAQPRQARVLHVRSTDNGPASYDEGITRSSKGEGDVLCDEVKGSEKETEK